MKVWTVSNQKGGVGKTTTVVTLGGLLSSWGFRTLLIDLDPHGALTTYFKMDPDQIKASVYNLFHDASLKKKDTGPEPYIVPTEFDNLFVLPAATAIATLDRQVAALGGMGLVIHNALNKVAGHYDYVIIDSPPMLGVLMINALAACEQLIIPVLAEFLAIKGLERMMHTLSMVFKTRQNAPQYTIVPTLFDKRTRAAQMSLLTLKTQYPDYLWNSVIPIDTKIRDASQQGIPLSLYFPEAKAVEAYSALLDQLLLFDSSDLRKTVVM
ncbi:MAG: cobalamin biosynthesis protein CobQ [Gammaproteobacteria bacterium HGW-Gammaproteobacteria-3]|nr:MAG: cobalamin biosynthesis protein CobQ [Gammaproteobacteria bacterium HGW-Gammaproteobacteria-3]